MTLMIEHSIHSIPPDIIKFSIVTLFSLLIGLEQRRHHIKEEFGTLFGTDRTFTLMGILGFILYIISPQNLMPFLGGGLVMAGLLAVYYFQKMKIHQLYGVTSLVTALITYCLAPLIYTQAAWLVFLIVVSVLVLIEIKETLFEFSKKFDNNEFLTLAKFLVLAGVILPLLPDKIISDEINISAYKFWLAIVAVSGISYLSYLLKKFIFPQSGMLLTGILGGLYSSTATTIILARKSKELPVENNKLVASILLATSMMYIRVLLLAFFFNKDIAFRLAPSFTVFILVSSLLAFYFAKIRSSVNLKTSDGQVAETTDNPLELKTSLLFAALFIFFALVTGYVTKSFGSGGITVLSFVVGVTDIDPFILNLFQGKLNMETSVLVIAVLNAITSNNLLKMIYGISLGSNPIRLKLIAGFGSLIVLGLALSFFIY